MLARSGVALLRRKRSREKDRAGKRKQQRKNAGAARTGR